MLSYLATKACTYAIKLIYISNCFALKPIVLFFSVQIYSFNFFFKPQLFYLKNYLNEAGLFLGHAFEGNYALSFPFTLISKMYMYTQLK